MKIVILIANKKASSRRGGGKFQGTDFNKLVPEQHL